MVRSEARRIGVIGLGRMGLPICARLAGAGHHITATDVITDKRAAALRAGATWRADAGAVAAAAEIVITVLPGPAEVAAVIDDVTSKLPPGSTWIEMSTASPAVGRAAAARAARHGIRVMDAPVGGDPAAVAEGRLLSFVGGDRADLEAMRGVLGALADRIVHVGPSGSGYAVKLLANSLWFGQAVATAEALTLARRAGLNVEVVTDALGQSAAASRFLADAVPALLAGDDLTSFALARCCEQLDSVLALGEELGVPLELGRVVSDVHHAALARYGEVDGELLGARFVAERGGVSFEPPAS
jgi:3-hydroxyisobutyrate dehydrogenase